MNKGEDLVSIIIPVYNVALYINECMDSVLAQTYQNIQVIVVDDGSDDGSGKICDGYAQKDSRVEVIHTVNGGPVVARKIGISKACGKYIGFVDADDYIAPDMYEVLVDEMKKTNSDFIHSGYTEIRGVTTTAKTNFPSEVVFFREEDDKEKFLKEFFFNVKSGVTLSYSIWSKLFKEKLIRKCYGALNDNQQVGEDGLCFLRCILESETICLFPKALYNYRIRKNSLSHSEKDIFAQKQIMLCSEFLKILHQYGYEQKMKREIYGFMQSSVLPYLRENDDERPFVNQYYLPNINFLAGKKVIIYGAGDVGIDLYCQMRASKSINIVCIVDKSEDKKILAGQKIMRPSEIRILQYDIILIAILDYEIAQQISWEMQDLGVDEKKVIWEKPYRFF